MQKSNVPDKQVTLTVFIGLEDNRPDPAAFTAGREAALPLNFLTSACNVVVAELPREDKERLLHELARECGYLLQPAVHPAEDFHKKLFLDSSE